MKLYPKKCPCGCRKVILEPFCGCQCSSVDAETAHQLMVRLNAFDDLVAKLTMLATEVRPLTREVRSATLSWLADLMEKLDKEPSFD